jgi:hypothetical protein
VLELQQVAMELGLQVLQVQLERKQVLQKKKAIICPVPIKRHVFLTEYECSWRLADVLVCSQEVSHPEIRLVSAALAHHTCFRVLSFGARWFALTAYIDKGTILLSS